jgi:hypothetical protein
MILWLFCSVVRTFCLKKIERILFKIREVPWRARVTCPTCRKCGPGTALGTTGHAKSGHGPITATAYFITLFSVHRFWPGPSLRTTGPAWPILFSCVLLDWNCEWTGTSIGRNTPQVLGFPHQTGWERRKITGMPSRSLIKFNIWFLNVRINALKTLWHELTEGINGIKGQVEAREVGDQNITSGFWHAHALWELSLLDCWPGFASFRVIPLLGPDPMGTCSLREYRCE